VGDILDPLQLPGPVSLDDAGLGGGGDGACVPGRASHGQGRITPVNRRWLADVDTLEAPVPNILVAVSAAMFVVILAISAYWDPTIRALHLFEAIPYLLAAWLCLRRVKSGYLLAIAGGLFWLWIAGTRTTFVREGFRFAGQSLRTGRLERPDVFIAAPAAIATAGLALFGLWGYARVRNKGVADVGLFLAAFVGMTGYFIAICALFAPRFLRLFTGMFS
jgi:hypothetical protein